MNQFQAERLLTTLYSVIICLSFTCSVACAIVWNHWKYVLDTCVNSNCGCILHGQSTFTFFNGGDVTHCHWAVYGLIVPIIAAIAFGIYHMYRVCINNYGKPASEKGTTTVRSTSRRGEHITMVTRTEDTRDEDAVFMCWIPSAIIGAVMGLYAIIHAAMLTNGYLRSCNQYRHEVVKLTRASGNMVGLIQGRLSCAAIYDYMDYLLPDVRDRRRYDFINTAAALQIALVCAWTAVVLWVASVIINSIQARNNKVIRQ